MSRIGSGSYVIGFVLADQQGWLNGGAEAAAANGGSTGDQKSPYADFVALDTFERLRGAVNDGRADFFMWEHFTSKRYYDSGEIRKIGEIYTPWSSWKIVASTAVAGGEGEGDKKRDPRLDDLFARLDQGIKHFNENKEEAVRYISTELDYSEEDAREWLKTVRFPEHTEGVDLAVVEKTVGILRKAGVLVSGKGMEPAPMIAKQR